MRLRSILKRSLELVGAHGGFGSLGRFGRRRDVIVLAYHNVVADEAIIRGDASLHIRERDFRRQVEGLVRTHDIVPLSSIFEASERRSGRPRAVITFDDAYLGAVTRGVHVLAEVGAPGTIFVAPKLLGGNTWWDLLASPSDGAVAPSTRDQCLVQFRGDGETILSHLDARVRPLDYDMRIASETELADAASHAGISIGSHTWSHPNLRTLDRSQIDQELRRSVSWLRDRYASFVPWLAYPYGLYNAGVEEAAREAGFDGALRVDGGWFRSSAPQNRFAVPRINIPSSASFEGFRLHIDGIKHG